MSNARQLAANLPREGGLSDRNLIINGNFTISQRGDYTSSTSVSDGNYYLDRWEYVEDGSPTSSLIHNTDGTVKITTGASVTGSSRLRQKFEYDKFPRQYDNKTFTVSAKIKSNSTNARINVYAGGYLSLTGTTAHSGGGSFETLTATFTTPSTISTEFSVHIGIDGASSANVPITSGEYFEVKEIQMERGDTATPFEHRSYGDELARCQRYYIQGGGGAYADLLGGQGFNITTTLCSMKTYLPVVMRAQPTFSYTGTPRVQNGQAGFALSNLTGGFPSGNEGKLNMFNMTGTSSGLTLYQPMNIDANAGGGFVKLDAEL